MTAVAAPSMGKRAIVRPWTVLAAGGTALHHGYELTSGVGLVWQPEFGLAGASALWGTQIPLWAVLAAKGGRRYDKILALLSGASLGGTIIHFLIWPWRRGRLGLPVLTDAEGLPRSQLPLYTALLYAWGVASAFSVRELPPRSRKWALIGLATTPLLRRSAMFHFDWLRQQAATNPAWWNRGVTSKNDE
jgi:hypothetical protein